MRALASSLRAQQALAEAERLDREALEITRTLYGETHVETYHGRMALAVLLEQKGDFAEAERVAREALRDAERLFGEANLNTALTLRTLGGVLLAAGREAEAEPVLRRALAAFARAAPNGNPDEGDVLNRLAYLAARRRAADAAALYGRAAALERGRAPDGPAFITDGYEYLGWAARRMRDPALAGRLYRRAVALYDRELPDGHPYRAEAHVGAGETLLEAGRAAEGTAELRAGLAQWEAARPPRPERVDEVRRRLEASRRP
jgi:tetratricopeptide (TPR) repeat protein